MSGRLTNAQKDQLQTWIGPGPKIFTLLYSITIDGCDPVIFHQKCDNQGPTVTVIYNTSNSVYGGYTSENWDATTSGYIADKNTFLFQLMFSGSKKENKFLCSDPKNAIYVSKTHGPNFGNNMNLRSFTTVISAKDGYFPLNSDFTNWGKSFDTKGISINGVNNDNKNVYELEVYKVQDGHGKTHSKKPWRKTLELNEKYLESLKEEIENFTTLSESEITKVRLLLFGPVASGKSSFCNTVSSVFRGRLSQKALCGKSRQSTTIAYAPYAVKTSAGKALNFLLCDTPGFSEEYGHDVIEHSFMLDGHIPDFYQFNVTKAIAPTSSDFVGKPSENSKAHCVVFVLDASTVDKLPPLTVYKISVLKTLSSQRNIPQAVILTNIDKVSEFVTEDITGLFRCDAMKSLVENVSSTFGFPINSIFPVKNYHSEVHLDDNVSILVLMALQQMLYLAEDYTETLVDRMPSHRIMVKTSYASEQNVTESDTA